MRRSPWAARIAVRLDHAKAGLAASMRWLLPSGQAQRAVVGGLLELAGCAEPDGIEPTVQLFRRTASPPGRRRPKAHAIFLTSRLRQKLCREVKNKESLLLATGTRAERTNAMPRADAQPVLRRASSMARLYSAGGVSIAESSQTCRRPAACRRVRPVNHSAGLLPPHVPGAIRVVSHSPPDLGQVAGERCGGEAESGGPFSRVRDSFCYDAT